MKKILILLTVILSVAASLKGESMYDKYGGVYHPYIHGDGGHTPTPKGFKPFYISHVGRHGSRYPVDHSFINQGMSPFVKANEAGLLSEQGKALLKAYERLDSISTGVYGVIDETGAAEHKGIARRMCERYAEVFHQADRDSVFVQSTHRQRCIMSALNFCSEFQSINPLKFSLVAGEKYYDILSNAETPQISERNKVWKVYTDSFALANFDFEPFYKRMFTDTEKAGKLIKSPRNLFDYLYSNGTVARYLGYDELYNAMLPDEYEFASRMYAARMNGQHCGSAECGAFRITFARPLLRDFIVRTDEALAGNGLAADFRFSHDTGLMPFFALIGLEGFDQHYSFEQAFEKWDATTLMCMATNLQLIFYRNSSGKVIVKILHNERESSIPALGPGPFYDWKDLKKHFEAAL